MTIQCILDLLVEMLKSALQILNAVLFCINFVRISTLDLLAVPNKGPVTHIIEVIIEHAVAFVASHSVT